MTGFDRDGRSYYLDDMDVKMGDKVVCKSSDSPYFTPGKVYEVLSGGMVIDNFNHRVRTSARFQYMERQMKQNQKSDNAMKMEMNPPSDKLRPVSGPAKEE